MPGKDFFDTNVLIYAIAKNDIRSSQAEALLARGGTISVQSLNECAAVARRKLDMSWPDIREFLQLICVLCPNPVPIALDTQKLATAIAERYRYQIYDALIAASALESGCKTLFSEDLHHGQVIERQLTIQNPFR